jgi:outer membrane protein OmpA-like peptidoglycan-associated protein
MTKNYLKTLFVASAAVLCGTPSHAQSPGSHSLEFSGGLREYIGDVGSYLMFSKAPTYQGGGLAFTYYLSPSIDAVANLSFGEVGATQDISTFVKENDILHRSFRAQTGDLTFGARYKFNNGLILSEDAKFAPYLYGGLSGYYVHSLIKWGPNPYEAAVRIDPVYGSEHKVEQTITDIGLALQGGLGFKFYLTDALSIHWQYTLTYTFNDRWDGANSPDPNPPSDENPLVNKLWRTNDAWGYHAIGLGFNFGGEGGGGGGGSRRLKDSDDDGVPNKFDKCKNTLPKYRRYVDSVGCPADSDGDGVLDADDDCMDKAGLPEFNGCPDTDGDGVHDKIDKCPKEKGLAALNGCPDSDGDGVADAADRCPSVAGIVALKGCPDGDGDGVADIDDKCPTLPGNIKAEGCPDSDGDGVFDNEDRCPNKVGTAANKGCPVIEEKVIQKIALAARGINFETNKAVILSSSFTNLNTLVDILNQYPEAFVEIQGHTDDVGDDAANRKLSQERADAVAEYVKGKGVNAARVTSKGYGKDMPIADNKTKAGKDKNRRVDFVLTY